MLAEDLVRMGMARLEKVKLVAAGGADRRDRAGGRRRPDRPGGGPGRGRLRPSGGAGEKSRRLGGHLATSKSLPPEEPPYDAPGPTTLPTWSPRSQATRDRVLTSARIDIHRRSAGPVHGRASNGGRRRKRTARRRHRAGHRGQALRRSQARPSGLRASPDVITSHELRGDAGPKAAQRPVRRQGCRSGWCSSSAPAPATRSTCPTARPSAAPTTLKQVAEIHELSPEIETAVVYRDMRTPGPARALLPGGPGAARTCS